MGGSYHWVFERGVSVASLGLVGSAYFTQHPLIDLGLAIVIPLHCHMGFGCIVTDYLPQRKFPVINKVTNFFLYALTVSTIYGLYEYNTKDVGITEGVRKLWKKENAVK